MQRLLCGLNASQILYIKLSDVCKEFCKEDLYVQIDRLFYLKQYK